MFNHVRYLVRKSMIFNTLLYTKNKVFLQNNKYFAPRVKMKHFFDLIFGWRGRYIVPVERREQESLRHLKFWSKNKAEFLVMVY